MKSIFFILVFLVLTSCGPKKTHRLQESKQVSSLQQTNIVETNQSNLEIKQLLDITKLNITFKPSNTTEYMQFIQGKDTIKTKNAEVSFRKEIDKSEVNTKQETESTKTDNSLGTLETSQEKNETTTKREGKKSNPWSWVAIIFSLAAVGYLYFNKAKVLSLVSRWFIKK